MGAPMPPPSSDMSQTQPKTTSLPPMIIESNGTIDVPFAGLVRVAGLSPVSAARTIARALSGKAINPRVLVTLVSNIGSIATVGGEANRPASFPLTLRGERILDLIGQAGGSKWPPFDTDVRVVRGSQFDTVKLQRIIDDPGQNIRISPNDQIFLFHNPMTFAVLGAAQKNSQYTFDTQKVTLADALGRAGGPIDNIGTPGAIYVFREETSRVISRLVAVGDVVPDRRRDDDSCELFLRDRLS